MSTEKKLDWKTVDATTLPPSVAKAYKALKEGQAMVGELRDAFETSFNQLALQSKIVTKDQELAFSYRFGQLSVAIKDPTEKKVKAGQISFG